MKCQLLNHLSSLTILLVVTGCAGKAQIQAEPKNASNTEQGDIAESETIQDAESVDLSYKNRKPFKFTITTDIQSNNNQNVEILVSLNSEKGNYPFRYDLDCDGDGDYEYKGLTKSQKCIYPLNSGTHQIWVRGDIPAMWLCMRGLAGWHPDCYHLLSDAFRESGYDKSIGDAMYEDRHCRMPDKLPEPDKKLDDNDLAVISIDDWGDIVWKSMFGFAALCGNLVKLPDNPPNLSELTDVSEMFRGAKSFNQPLDNWDVSNVTDMNRMFEDAVSFNQPLEKWDVSKVENMHNMFWSAESFNQPLDNWDVSNVTDMSFMFAGATSFNQPLKKWDVSNVTDMSHMFAGATSFNQPLEKWNVSKVKDMSYMFENATSFNQPMAKWDVSNVTDMSYMFAGATSFNQPLEAWNISTVQSMLRMFRNATSFNQSLENWNVTSVLEMDEMFKGCMSMSYYPESCIIPADASSNMFEGTKIETLAKTKPLKSVNRPKMKRFYIY